MNLEGTPTAPLTVQCAYCRRWIARGTTCQHCWPGHPNPVPEGEHNRADAPPSAIDTALSWRKDAAPALPLELVAADALECAESALLGVRDGTASYHDLTVALASIVAILRGGLGDDHDDAA